MMEFNAWSFTRRAMGYGEIIQFDSVNLQRDTETHNAVMDAKAAELSKEIYAHLQSSIASLEAERDKLKESISHFSGLLGEETQKRYSLEAERDRAVELLEMSLHSGVGVQDYQLREAIESFLASIGGEEK